MLPGLAPAGVRAYLVIYPANHVQYHQNGPDFGVDVCEIFNLGTLYGFTRVELTISIQTVSLSPQYCPQLHKCPKNQGEIKSTSRNQSSTSRGPHIDLDRSGSIWVHLQESRP